ncbi:MAG TPA: FAD-containing oxidoreductase [Casimicrobiaceae bacterium]|jgi:pyruvate/2-oxoglutarate dehydrogenase complex dihydrolipoamide dehydrogenase (E3) component|nr:FAD-containing oxidoreductase [Casimicrobiaceae bacterium]
MSERFDAIVIGAGQAGPPLAVRLARSGRTTAIIERKILGGTCVNNGCIPTKTLIASARSAHVARRGGDYGVTIEGPIRVDMAQVKRRKDSVVRDSVEGLTGWISGTAGLTLIHGHARFESPKLVRVGERLLEAEAFFINVGARAWVPEMPGLAEVPYLTNSTMMHVDFLPEHLVIVGGSYIGLEFAQTYRRFGSRVTVIEMAPRLIGREDDDVAAAIQAILEAEGIAFRLSAKCVAVAARGGGVAVHMSCEEDPREIAGSHVLLAVGRVPNTADLGLDRAGVATDARGYIGVDDQLRTNVPGIWALGEANGRGAFTHTSFNDYEIVAANLLDGESRRVTERIATYALFIDPPLGRAGMTEKEVRASGRPALVATMPMTRVGRARERGETQGFMRVLVDAKTERLLGASLLGIEGDEVVQSLLDAMYADAPYTVLRRAMHIHPTVTELIPTLLGELRPLT